MSNANKIRRLCKKTAHLTPMGRLARIAEILDNMPLRWTAADPHPTVMLNLAEVAEIYKLAKGQP